MRVGPLIAGCVALLTAWTAAAATDRYYPDCTAASPNGQYRLDAKSPDNLPPGRPFATNFTYTLTDTRTGKVVWTRKQPMTRAKGSPHGFPDEASPTRLFVHDSGFVAVLSAHHDVIFLDAGTGKRTSATRIIDHFTSDELKSFVIHSTAGMFWAQYSAWTFVDPPAEPAAANRVPSHFAVRPYWGRRFIIEVQSGRVVNVGPFAGVVSETLLDGATSEERWLMLRVLASERAQCLARVRGAAAAMGAESDVVWEVTDAVNLAGQLRLKEAMPALRAAEEAAAGMTLEPYAARIRLVAQVRQAIRRIGETPVPGYGYSPHNLKAEVRRVASVEERATNASKVKPEMLNEEVFSLLGLPDFHLHRRQQAYDYDIDGAEPYTLRLYLDMSGRRVSEVQVSKPPIYSHPHEREQSAW